ncbi:MAG: sigma-70 family RNA polymerase sigma factor [Oscillospiraceae bacterium]|jgi:RNA polymerase sigma factor (sigma-70 family)
MDAYKLYEENEPLVYAYIRKHYPRYLRDEDMLQAARIGLWTACLRSDGCRSSFSTYACACMENEIRAEYRLRRERQTSLSWEAGGSDPAEEAIDRAHARALLRRLSGGDSRTRSILLARMEGLTLCEIGEKFGMSRHQVSRRIRAARQRLNSR